MATLLAVVGIVDVVAATWGSVICCKAYCCCACHCCGATVEADFYAGNRPNYQLCFYSSVLSRNMDVFQKVNVIWKRTVILCESGITRYTTRRRILSGRSCLISITVYLAVRMEASIDCTNVARYVRRTCRSNIDNVCGVWNEIIAWITLRI